MSIYLGTSLLSGSSSTAVGVGSGGLLNVRKYSTFRATGGATTTQLFPDFTASHVGSVAASSTAPAAVVAVNNFPTGFAPAADALVGIVLEQVGGNLTITTNRRIDGTGSVIMTLNRQDGSVGGLYNTLANGDTMQFRSTNTVNPATDLSLSDGDLLGYFMVAGGAGGIATNEGGDGGRILQGTIVVPTAATDLTLTIGLGGPNSSEGTHSTITGGLTLSTVDGSRGVGWAGGATSNTGAGFAAGNGINGYGAGGAGAATLGGTRGLEEHGFGSGGSRTEAGGDGAILLIY